MKKSPTTLCDAQKKAKQAQESVLLDYLESKKYNLLGASGQDPAIYFYRNKKNIICVPKPDYDILRLDLAMEWETEDFMDRFCIDKEQIDSIGIIADPIDTDDIVEYIQEEHDYSFSCC